MAALDLLGLKLFEKKDETQAAADGIPYSTEIVVATDDGDLRSALEAASTLAGEEDAPPPGGTIGLTGRARSDLDRLIATLYAGGRYGGTVDITIAGRPLGAIEPDAVLQPAPDTGKVPVMIRVDPGPQFHFGETRVEVQNGGADYPGAGELGLRPGAPAESGAILSAADRIVAELRRQGHPLARIERRDVVADHATATLDVTLIAVAGPTARIGRVTVTGTEQVDAEFVRRQTAIVEGEPYSPETLRRAAERLRRLEVFDSVRVREGEGLDADGTLPVFVEVSERKARYVGAGATWSSVDGAEIEAHWGHRNLFGGAERLRVEGRVGRIGEERAEDLDYSLGATFVKPGVLGIDTDFTAEARILQERPDVYSRRSASAKVGLTRRFDDKTSGSIGLEFERSNIIDKFGERDFMLFGIPAELVRDTRDNPLDPKRGYRAVVFAEPIYDSLQDNFFLVSKASFSAYRALDSAGRFVLAGRVLVGSVSGTSLAGLPADRRFFGGGGGSVRGYAYKNIGPRVGGSVVGGRSIVEASLEARIMVTDKIGIVPFVDIGQVADTTYPQIGGDLKVGVGAGVRYLTPIGPLRLDVAVPLNKDAGDPDWAVYLGLGQSF
ncbi:MAG: outer membrane protein assembly factor [Hyphomicrobiales bacterium]|nr:outer membrane protein assembly factor [Hyphomicrobiales bacterium]